MNVESYSCYICGATVGEEEVVFDSAGSDELLEPFCNKHTN